MSLIESFHQTITRGDTRTSSLCTQLQLILLDDLENILPTSHLENTYIPSVPGCLVKAGAHRELVVDEVGADDGDLGEKIQLLVQVRLQV